MISASICPHSGIPQNGQSSGRVPAMSHLVCDDGNLGEYHGELIKLNLYLSRVQWERGYRDDAFASLDEALPHARALERHKS